jgi:hypothetical protein
LLAGSFVVSGLMKSRKTKFHNLIS